MSVYILDHKVRDSRILKQRRVVYPPTEEEAISTDMQEVDTTVQDDIDLSISGPITIILPKGIEMEGITSEEGELQQRQKMVDRNHLPGSTW